MESENTRRVKFYIESLEGWHYEDENTLDIVVSFCLGEVSAVWLEKALLYSPARAFNIVSVLNRAKERFESIK